MANFLKRFIEEISLFGSFPFMIFMIILLFSINQTRIMLTFLLAIIIGTMAIFGIRLVYHRLRPEHEKRGHIKFKSLFERLDDASFPSMHSMRISIISVALYMIDKRLIYLGVLLAVSVFFSRKFMKKHHWSDIIFGCFIGLIAFYLARLILQLFV